jgi:acetamidase/formamidase
MKIHRFQPAEYHPTLGSHPPVLEIENGGRVITSTVDNMGRDAADREITAPGNPQTGPFYLCGAEPGDTLAVTFERITPNRPTGRTRGRIAPHVLDPGYLETSSGADGGGGGEVELLEWRIDVEAWNASLLSPEFPSGRLILPLDPMVGCFGTAPPKGQAIAASTAGPYGGNMDYRGFRAGTTVYLPVFVQGALFHLGDVHALQGDGEITGTGIEVSAEVEFTLRLIEGRSVSGPRAEDRDWILTAGNARPLAQALQEATTEMLRWLIELGLEEKQAHILMGQCVQYEVGNVFDPAYTMICRLGKSLLADVGLEQPWM